MAPEPDVDPETPTEAAPTAAASKRVTPRIDVSPALHDAGHEVADLGFADIPDSGPLTHPDEGPAGPDDPLDFVTLQMPSD